MMGEINGSQRPEAFAWKTFSMSSNVFQGEVVILGDVSEEFPELLRSDFQKLEPPKRDAEEKLKVTRELALIFNFRTAIMKHALIPTRMVVGAAIILDVSIGQAAAFILERGYGI